MIILNIKGYIHRNVKEYNNRMKRACKPFTPMTMIKASSIRYL
jgi:hypothetical protein